eukprot:g470.t1
MGKKARSSPESILNAATRLEALLEGEGDGRAANNKSPIPRTEISSRGLARAVGEAQARQKRLQSARRREQKREEELKKQQNRPLAQGSPAMQKKAQMGASTTRGFGCQNTRDRDFDTFVKRESKLPSPHSYSPTNNLVRPSSPKPRMSGRMSPMSPKIAATPAGYYPKQYRQRPTSAGGLFGRKHADELDMETDRFFEHTTSDKLSPTGAQTQPKHGYFPGSMVFETSMTQTDNYRGKIRSYEPKHEGELLELELSRHPGVGDYETVGTRTEPDVRLGRNSPGGSFYQDKNSSFLAVHVRNKRYVPGPGAHEIDRSLAEPVKQTAKWNEGDAKTEQEWQQYVHRDEPGPADTQPTHGFDTKEKTLGKFPKATGTYVDEYISATKKRDENACPGDGKYKDPRELATSSGRYANKAGGKFSKERKFFGRNKIPDTPSSHVYRPKHNFPPTSPGGAFSIRGSSGQQGQRTHKRFFDASSLEEIQKRNPSPVQTQPKHGYFPGSMVFETSMTQTDNYRGKIRSYEPKHEGELLELELSRHPGVGDYEVKGSNTAPDLTLGASSPLGTIGKDGNSSFLTVHVRANRYKPGPGAHELDRTLKPKVKQPFGKSPRHNKKQGMLEEKNFF